MPKKLSFNWSGITENGDGSFTVQGKAARKRLLKEFHKQGLQVRSQKQSDGTYILSGIGERQPHGRRGLPPRIGNRPQSRYPVRGYPPRGIRPQFRGGLPSRPFARPQQAPPRLSPTGSRGPSRYGDHIRQQIVVGGEHREQEKIRKQGGFEEPKLREQFIKNTGSVPTSISHETRVNESLQAEEEMKKRSGGQKNTRIPTRTELWNRQMEQRNIRLQARESQQAPAGIPSAWSNRGSGPTIREGSQNIKMNDKPMNSADLEALRQNAE